MRRGTAEKLCLARTARSLLANLMRSSDSRSGDSLSSTKEDNPKLCIGQVETSFKPSLIAISQTEKSNLNMVHNKTLMICQTVPGL
jgi:hypothetical protein